MTYLALPEPAVAVTLPELRVLAAIAAGHGTSQNGLARALAADRGRTFHVIARLETLGLVARAPVHPGGRGKGRAVALTPQGQHARAAARAALFGDLP